MPECLHCFGKGIGDPHIEIALCGELVSFFYVVRDETLVTCPCCRERLLDRAIQEIAGRRLPGDP